MGWAGRGLICARKVVIHFGLCMCAVGWSSHTRRTQAHVWHVIGDPAAIQDQHPVRQGEGECIGMRGGG